MSTTDLGEGQPGSPLPGGEMAGRVHACDWAATPLGPMAGWPRSLAVVADLVTAHPLPAAVLWGPELIQVQNDALAGLIDHQSPPAQGRPGRLSWPEAWPVTGPICERVLAGDGPVLLADQLLPRARRGAPEDAYFTLACSPVRGDDGRVAGVFLTIIETTAKVRAGRERDRRAVQHRVEAAPAPIRGDDAASIADDPAAVERAKVEAALRDREADLARVQRIGRVGGLNIDVAGGLRGWRSPEYLRLHGLPEDAAEETHADWLARVHPDDRDDAERALFSALRSDAPVYRNEYRIIRPVDGGVRWIQVRADIERAADGTPLRLVGAHVDVTEQKRMQAALQASEARLRLALAAARMGTWTWDVAGDEHHRDANLNALLGLPAVETIRPLDDFLGHAHPADRAAIRAAFEASVRHGRPLHVEFRVVRPDGSTRWLRDQGDVSGASASPRLAGACVDVTDLKEVEEALRASERRLRAVAANLPNAAVFVVDPDLRYALAEGEALRKAGFAPRDLEGKSVVEALGRELAAQYEPHFRRALAGEEVSVEHSSHGRSYATHLAPLPGPEGRPVAALAVSYDITDRVRAEEEVRRARDELEARVAERTADLHLEMARRRDLARRLGTAQEDERRRVSRDLHDSVGQLLAALPIAFRAVEAAGDLPAPAAARLAEARRLVDAVSREVHALAVRLRPTALDDLGLEVALDLLVSEWSGRSDVPADFQSSGLGPGRLPPEVETAVYRLVQEALTNVAKHARATGVSAVVSRLDGSVTAVIEDDGVGFAPDAVPKGRLGLVGMRERVALVGGELAIESRPGEGTAILIRIPLPEGGGG